MAAFVAVFEMTTRQFKTDILPIKHKLYRFALRILHHAAEAEDVVQEVFIKLWNNREQSGTISNVEAWCITATKNLAIDKLRSKHRRLQPLNPALDPHDQGSSPYQITAGQDVFETVKKLMDSLPEKQRDIMHLRDIEGMQYQEIAEALDIPLDQVKVYLFRARKTVREALSKLQMTPGMAIKG
jgi:RNA polymerase sigma-70 factor (ECF subfamily)